VNAVIGEALADGVSGFAEGHAVSPYAVGVGSNPGPEGRARRGANGLAVVSALVTYTLRRKTVKVRRAQSGFHIAIQHVVTSGFFENDDRLARLRIRLTGQAADRQCGDARCAGKSKKISTRHGITIPRESKRHPILTLKKTIHHKDTKKRR
jgi:hypothetical protein